MNEKIGYGIYPVKRLKPTIESFSLAQIALVVTPNVFYFIAPA